MKITYDKISDAAYIYLMEINVGDVAFTYNCNPLETKSMINLDFNRDNQLLGIEIMDASKKLQKEILEKAEDVTVRT